MKQDSAYIAAIVVAIAVGGFVGFGISQANPKVVEKTVTKSVEVTPESCLQALDYDERFFRVTADALGSNDYTYAGNVLNEEGQWRLQAAEQCRAKAGSAVEVDG